MTFVPRPSPARTATRTATRTASRAATRAAFLSALTVGTLLATAGCSGAGAPAGTAADAGSGILSGVCPATVTVQLDWEPEADYAGLFQMLGSDYTVDTAAKSVTGPLVDADGVSTGVNLEIRSGGGAVGYQPVTSLMYTDPDILIGTVSTEQAMTASDAQPVVGVATLSTYSPYILFWDPEKHPDWTGIADAKASGDTVLVSASSAYPQWLVGKGLLDQSQIDTSYDSGPARFVSDSGIVVEGYATNTPYVYENDIAAWKRPLAYQALKDVGYEMYPSALSVRADDVEKQSACLSALIPIYQKAFVSYMADPSTVNATVVDLVEQYDTSWIYTPEIADFAHEQYVSGGFVENSADGSLGGFDTERMQRNLDEFVPILRAQGSPVADDLTIDDIATNRFIDPAIGLPAS